MLLGLGQWNWVCIHDVWKGLHGHQFGNVEPLYLHLPYQPNMAHSIYSICTSNTSSLTTDFIVYSYKKNTYQRKVLLEIFKRSSLMTYHIYIYLIIIYINLYIYIYTYYPFTLAPLGQRKRLVASSPATCRHTRFFGVRGLGRGFLEKRLHMLFRYPVIVIPGTFMLYR